MDVRKHKFLSLIMEKSLRLVVMLIELTVSEWGSENIV